MRTAIIKYTGLVAYKPQSLVSQLWRLGVTGQGASLVGSVEGSLSGRLHFSMCLRW